MHETTCSPRAQALKADVELNVEELLKDPTTSLRSMLHIVPGWDQECAKEAQVQQISGAMSNLVYRCSSARGHENATVIARVFGRGGEVFSAGSERAIFVRASTLGLGPRCLVEFVGGRVEEFLPGLNLTPLTMRQPAVAAAIARAMAHFNVEMLPAAGGSSGNGSGGALVPSIWPRLRQWHKVAVEVAPEEVEQLGLTHADKEISQLEASFTARFPLWLGFVHNDLQYGNMLLFGAEQAQHEPQQSPEAVATAAESAGPDAGAELLAGQQQQQQQQQARQQQNGMEGAAGEQEEEEGLAVRLIDYEYSGVNDVALDVGNYWVEYCYDYHSDTPEAVDWSLFPTPDQQRSFCAAYVVAMAEVLQQLRRQQKEQPHGTAAAAAEGAGGSGDGGCALTAEDSAFLGACAGASAGSSNGGTGTGGSSSANGIAGGEPGIALAEAVLAAAGGGQQGGGNVGQHERAVELLAEKARAYATITHLHWSLWGLIQLKMSDCDFSYFEYARQRVALYHKDKVALLS